MSGVVYIKNSNNWIACNFGNVNIHVKDAGVWNEITTGRKVHVKVSGTWQQAYPSLDTSWTSYETPADAVLGSFSIPELSFDVSWPVSNLTTPSDEVRWDDRNDDINQDGRDIDCNDFGWSDNVPGSHSGAIDRMSITFASRYVGSKLAASKYRAIAKASSSGMQFTGNLTNSFVTYTLDYVVGVGGWEIADTDTAGNIFDGTGLLEASMAYDNDTETADKQTALKEFQVKLQYLHN